jgi:hypothetical protein
MESEWLSTSDARYNVHRICGKSVKLSYGLPGRHSCDLADIENLKDTRVSRYSNGDCLECGSTVHGPQRGQHSNFHANFIHRAEVRDGFAVSAVKWCDLGNHAFKASEDGAQSIDIMQRTPEGDERVTMDMCAAHAFPTGATPAPMRAVESAYKQEQNAQAQTMQADYQKQMQDRLNTPMNIHSPADFNA